MLQLLLLQAEWRLADDGRSSMILKLSEPTNRPALETAVDLNNAIAITIMTDHDDTPVKMQTGRGVWSPDGDALTITEMDSDSWKAAVAAISAGTLRATLRKKLLVGATLSTGRPGGFVDDESSSGELRGTLTMRMSSPGRFGARLFVGEKLDSTSARFVDVELCPEQVVVDDDAKPTDSSPGPGRALATLPSPFFSVGGVLAMPGDRWLKVNTVVTCTKWYAWGDRLGIPQCQRVYEAGTDSCGVRMEGVTIFCKIM